MQRLAARMTGAIRALVFRRRAERDLDDELQSYLDAAVEQKVRAGMNRTEAVRAARAEMGSPEAVKDAVRDVGWESWIDGFARDVRYALRTLRHAPGFTAVAVVTLALGIGANTAVYSAIDAAFFRPLPFPEPDQIVHLHVREVQVPLAIDRAPIGIRPVYVTDLYDTRDTFAHAAAYASGGLNLGSGAEPRRVTATFVTTEFFQVFRRAPQLGRTFAPGETSTGGPDVMVLSYGLWQAHFGGDPSIVGRSIRLDDRPFVVVGVMPHDFRFPAQADLWLPLPLPVPLWTYNAFRNSVPQRVVARLDPGVTPESAAARFDTIRAPWIEAQRTRGRRDITPVHELVVPLQRFLTGSGQTVLALSVLMASAGLVLLIACANVATLLLSRAATRRFEITTHAVLGATRARIVRRLLVESLLLALAGAALGLGVAAASVPVLAALIPQELVGLAPVHIDTRVLLFTAGVATTVGIAFGLWPALGVSRAPLAQLQASGTGVSGVHVGMNRALVVAEVALACLLVIGAGLMLTSLRSLLGQDLGMRPDLVATAQLNFPSQGYDRDRRSAFARSVLDILRAAPGIHAAAAISTIPFTPRGTRFCFATEDGTHPDSDPCSPVLVASPGYFDTMGIGLLRGRDLEWSDGGAVPVAVINRTAAQMLWPGEDPIGRRFRYMAEAPRTVVGLVENARIEDPNTEAGPQIYTPLQELPQAYVSIVARGTTPAEVPAALAHIRTAVTRTDPTLPVYDTHALATAAAATVAARRVNTLLLGAFGALALGLAFIGVYGLLAYSVARRTRELGIRMALGAEHRTVLRSIMGQGLALVAAGLVLGVGAALATTRYLESMLYEVAPRDPWTFAGVVLLFLAAAVVATYLPARRATRVDPVTALRCN